jgi:hypothetical protein
MQTQIPFCIKKQKWKQKSRFEENERKQAYGRLGFYYSCHAVCGIALFIIGTVSLSQLTNDSRWNTSYWYQIYYGAYIVAGIVSYVLYTVKSVHMIYNIYSQTCIKWSPLRERQKWPYKTGDLLK